MGNCMCHHVLLSNVESWATPWGHHSLTFSCCKTYAHHLGKTHKWHLSF
jgi:hypothetical protein